MFMCLKIGTIDAFLRYEYNMNITNTISIKKKIDSNEWKKFTSIEQSKLRRIICSHVMCYGDYAE